MNDDDPIHIFRKGESVITFIKSFGAGIGLSLAASYAAEIDAKHLFYGVHKDDKVFNENNREFFTLMSKAISIEIGTEFNVHTPFLEKSKAEVLKLGYDLGMPAEETWSCASNSSIHCGWCDPCQDRINAFRKTNLNDTTLYENSLVKSSSNA
ncbi:7-cyano-7-deazaguanine synthase [Virgibacillus dokdonensis]|nr:7-cyano-7-deazaguanine synthase [Virgibacillus dokdonensis]